MGFITNTGVNIAFVLIILGYTTLTVGVALMAQGLVNLVNENPFLRWSIPLSPCISLGVCVLVLGIRILAIPSSGSRPIFSGEHTIWSVAWSQSTWEIALIVGLVSIALLPFLTAWIADILESRGY